MEKIINEWIKSEDSGKPFKCTLCQKDFFNKKAVLRHINQSHKNNLQYECNDCGSKYKSKYALKRHIETNYMSSLPHRCTVCEANFRLPKELNHHMKNDHPDARSFKCNQCFATFKVKGDLQRHVDRIHSIRNEKEPPRSSKGLICILCDKAFARKSMILFHLEKDHSIRLAFETYHFANIDEFYEWKNEIEKIIVCRYIKVRCDKTKKCSIFSYLCHRSGIYVPHATKNMRRLKLQGSKKMNGFCPSEMSLRRDNESGSCILTYLKTHIGHPTADETELAHVYLSKEEKRKLAEKIAVGTSFDKILNDLYGNNETDRLCILENHDLHNIASSYNLKASRCTKTYSRAKSTFGKDNSEFSSFKSVDEFILKYPDSILYYKKEDELDDLFVSLKAKDVIIIIMSETQRSMLQKFGGNVVAVGGFYKDESYDFYIQTLLAVDNYSEAFVCAFAISNRGDDDIVNIFFCCIRENVNELSPNCLITDIRDVFHDGWIRTMSTPQYWLLSSWHVKQALKNKLQYVSNKEKQNQIKEKLDSLCAEPNEHEFLVKLNEFFNSEDADTVRFFEYFRHTFVKNIHLWAHCYHLNVDSNANVYMESFHNIFRHLQSRSKKCKKFCDILIIFEKYLQLEERLLKIKEIRGRLSNKLRLLRKRHDYALRNSENVDYSLRKNECGNWALYSYSSKDNENVVELFDVQCVNPDRCPIYDDCKLVCEKCEVCAHQYKCSCKDSSTKNNMCHHVHTVCLHVKNQAHSNTSLLTDNANNDCTNETNMEEIDSSHVADDFSIEILNWPRTAHTLSENIAVTEITNLPVSMHNEFDPDNLNDLEEIPFCDVIEIEDGKARLKEALSTAVVVDTASAEADLCFIKEVTPAIVKSSSIL